MILSYNFTIILFTLFFLNDIRDFQDITSCSKHWKTSVVSIFSFLLIII